MYLGALAALGPLFALALEVAAVGEATTGDLVDVSWDLKPVLRFQRKVVEKCAGRADRVADIARASLVFPSLIGLLAALDHLLHTQGEQVPVLKNRFRERGDCRRRVDASCA